MTLREVNRASITLAGAYSQHDMTGTSEINDGAPRGTADDMGLIRCWQDEHSAGFAHINQRRMPILGSWRTLEIAMMKIVRHDARLFIPTNYR